MRARDQCAGLRADLLNAASRSRRIRRLRCLQQRLDLDADRARFVAAAERFEREDQRNLDLHARADRREGMAGCVRRVLRAVPLRPHRDGRREIGAAERKKRRAEVEVLCREYRPRHCDCVVAVARAAAASPVSSSARLSRANSRHWIGSGLAPWRAATAARI